MAAGLLVGLLDGGWAAIAWGVDVRGGVSAALLAAGVDGLLGAGGAILLELLARLAWWGRSGRLRRQAGARAGAALALGACAALATVAAAAATIDRRNRFLAAGVVSIVALIGGLIGTALLPWLARFLSRRRTRPARARHPDPAFLLLAPLAILAVELVIASAATDLRPPLPSASAARRLVLIGVEAGLLPGLLWWAEELPLHLRWFWAAPPAVALLGGGLLVFALRNWEQNLRFIPWTDVVPGLAIAVIAIGNVPLVARFLHPPSVGKGVLLAIGGTAVLLLLVLLASESETARKVTSAHSGMVGPVLAAARRALDRDHDGYPRLLGGGDCDDADPTIHPGALDFPDDGIDQDCDGKDASTSRLVAPPFATVPDAVPKTLNILLITIDTVRADHLGCYGYGRPTSPAIDRLAAEGGLFLEGWAHAPSTRYSMPAIATGRWPTTIEWDESIWWPRISPRVPTLAEALKAQGYFTAAFFSYDYFSAADRRGFERGVDLYRTDRASLHQAVNGPMESRGSSSREMADDAIAFLETHRELKFFLWVHFYDPHLSYEPHAEVPSFGSNRMDLYDGEIRFTDLHVGRVLDRLRTLGLWDRTAVVVTGDHGEGFGEHGITEHGFDLYAAQTKVPFIVRVPGLAPRRISDPAGHIDLAPTLLNLARGARSPSFLGRSLVSDLATGGPSATAPQAGEDTAAPTVIFQEVSSERGMKRALVNQDLHVIWNWTPDNTTECYDRRHDPDERRDLWGRSGDAACRRLKADLQGMVSAFSMPADVAQKLRSAVFSPGAVAPQPAHHLEASIGDLVTVQGYTLTPAVGTSPAGEVEVAILFACRKTIPAGWRFFFHLMGPGGSFRNLDHLPVDGAMPPERWRAGQRILDRVRVRIPPGAPPGRYELILGLFRGTDRLPVSPTSLSDGKQALRLVTIQIP